MPLEALPHGLLVAFAVAFGLVFGSFLNVVIHRLPRGESVVSPPSSCPACGKRIRSFDNVPVLSWLVLRGKARCCGVPIAARYPLVELLGGVMAWAVLDAVVLRDPTRAWHQGLLLFACYGFFAYSLLAALFIDLEHMLLPDEITLTLAGVGLLSAPLRDVPLVNLLIGGVAGYVVVWLPFIWLYSMAKGHPGMGLGDAKLLMAIGCWSGTTGALFSLLAGAVQGTVFALVVFAIRGRLEEPAAVAEERRALQEHLAQLPPEQRAALEAELSADPLASEPKSGLGQARLAFGPFLALAALQHLFWGELIVDGYLTWVWNP